MTFPFAAVVGRDDAKTALLASLVDPAIGGVLLVGEKGGGKSTLARAAAEIRTDAPFVNLPVSATEDMLVGGIDLAGSLRDGRPRGERGVLERANGGLLYVDEVNLLPDALATALLDAAATGELRIEREGMSRTVPSCFVLVGSMNPEEGGVRPQLADRFGLTASFESSRDVGARVEVVRRRLEFERDPEGFRRTWRVAQAKLTETVEDARRAVAAFDVTDRDYQAAADYAAAAGAAGHRGELCLLRAARALAALAGRSAIADEDLSLAAQLALGHRVREGGLEADAQPSATPERDRPVPRDSASADPAPTDHEPAGDALTEAPSAVPEITPIDVGSVSPSHEEIFEIKPGVVLPNLWDRSGSAHRRALSHGMGSGRRQRFVSGDRSGRFTRARRPKGRASDIAVGDTIKAAILRRSVRGPAPGDPGWIRPDDLRVKVRVRRTGGHLLFVVDASGSMAGARRMALAKGAVFSLLGDSYRKRDTVGLIVFRGDAARVVLPPTRSVVLADRRLREIPTGGATPLSDAIRTACRAARAIVTKDAAADPLVVFLSDGRERPVNGALEAAQAARQTGHRFVWVDTENPWVRVGAGRDLAEAMGARYLRLP